MSAPPAGQSNLSPFAGLQFFGEVHIDRTSRDLTVILKNVDGDSLYSKILAAE
jgi:alkaline phosphatase D